MDFKTTILYVLVFAAYIMLFSFMFDNSNESIEGLVYILLFLLTCGSGIKLLHDLYNESGGPSLNNLLESFFSDSLYSFVAYIVLIGGIVGSVIGYVNKQVSESFVAVCVLATVFFIINMMIKEFNMYKSLLIPIISMILTSVNLFLLSMYNKTSIFGKIEFKDEILSKYLKIIKGMFVSMVVLIIVFSGINYKFVYFILNLDFLYMLYIPIGMHIPIPIGFDKTDREKMLDGEVFFYNLLLIAMHIIGLIITSYSYQVLIKKNYNEKNKLK